MQCSSWYPSYLGSHPILNLLSTICKESPWFRSSGSLCPTSIVHSFLLCKRGLGGVSFDSLPSGTSNLLRPERNPYREESNGMPLPRARVHAQARVFVACCSILLDCVAFCRILLTASWGYRGLRIAGRGLRIVDCKMSPWASVSRSGHRTRVVRRFCFVKCDWAGSMCPCRRGYGCASDAGG